MWAAAIPAAASIVGGMMGSSAAKKAAAQQAAAADRAIAEQQRQFDVSRADNAPFMQTGTAANKRLAYLLGLSTDPGTGGGAGGGLTYESLRTQLAPQFTNKQQYTEKVARHGWTTEDPTADMYVDQVGYRDVVNQGDLDKEITRRLAEQAANEAALAQGDTQFGSLTRKFGAGDLASDVVYNTGLEFGAQQGTDAINARAIATGGYDSGATLKALTRFGNDYGTTKAEGAYNRFNTDQGNLYNRLAGVSGAGQQAVNTVTSAGQNTASNIGNLMTQAGNASAAGIVGGANAWGNALTGVSDAYNNYQNNQRLDALLKRGSASSSGGSIATDPYYG